MSTETASTDHTEWFDLEVERLIRRRQYVPVQAATGEVVHVWRNKDAWASMAGGGFQTPHEAAEAALRLELASDEVVGYNAVLHG